MSCPPAAARSSWCRTRRTTRLCSCAIPSGRRCSTWTAARRSRPARSSSTWPPPSARGSPSIMRRSRRTGSSPRTAAATSSCRCSGARRSSFARVAFPADEGRYRDKRLDRVSRRLDGAGVAQSSVLESRRSYLRPALAGAAATLSGIGLARFAYVPLFPAMVAAGWVSGAQAGFLGAVNLTGYLVGVLGGRSLAGRLGTARALDLGMALAAIAFAACGWNGGVAWLALWRGLAGLAGGVLMALAGPAVQGAVSPAARGSAGGVVIAGVGSGVILGSLAVPALLSGGVAATWLGLAGLVLLLWGFAHPRWPGTPVRIADGAAPPAAGLYALYGLAGAGMVPHMVYFVDLAVRGRGVDSGLGALTWLLFGVGAILGTLAGGCAADRLGGAAGLRIWLGLQAAGVALALLPGTATLVP